MDLEEELPGIVHYTGASIARKMSEGAFIGDARKKNRHYIIESLRIYSTKGKTLEWCSGSKILNRAVRTLEAYCREAEISFPDYTPRAMKKLS